MEDKPVNPSSYTEDTLVQQTTADYLRDELGWESVYAYNEETFGPEGTLGRKSDSEVILGRYLGEALVKLNPGLPIQAYQEAIRRITEYSVTQSTLQINNEKHNLFKDGCLLASATKRANRSSAACVYSISTSQRTTTF